MLSYSVIMFTRLLFLYFIGNYCVFIYYSLYKSLLLGSKKDQIEGTLEALDGVYLLSGYDDDDLASYLNLFYKREFCRLLDNSSFYFYALLFSVKTGQIYYYFFFYRLMYFFFYDYISSDFLVDLAEYELRD